MLELEKHATIARLQPEFSTVESSLGSYNTFGRRLDFQVWYVNNKFCSMPHLLSVKTIKLDNTDKVSVCRHWTTVKVRL